MSARKDTSAMTTPSDTNLRERYQDYRRQRTLKRERAYAYGLPGWRTQRRRRLLVKLLFITFVFMAAVSILCAVGVQWAPLLWLPACAAFFPLWWLLQTVSGRRGDASTSVALDEFEVAQRNSARSVGLTVTQTLTLIPALYLIFGSTMTHNSDPNMAYAGGLMTLTTLLAGGATPAMILGWKRTDPEPDDNM